jgi:2-amino-4-hydroxy-6-hydroxymethyldihydropteridine diphosphokinase
LDQAENNRANQKIVYLAFGSNQMAQLQGSVEVIQSSYALLNAKPVHITTFSPFFQTPAFPAGNGPDYVNSVVRAQTSLTAQELMDVLHNIETQLGRERKQRWGARNIDIDLLDYDGRILPTRKAYNKWRGLPLELQKTEWPDELVLPHPRIQDRGFVLVPLKAVARDWVHPVTGENIDTLIGQIDRSELLEIVQISD